MEKQKKNLGSVAFLPLIVFLVCYVGCGITFTLMGADDPFGKFPRHVALLAGCAVALLLNRSMDVKDKLNIMTTNMGNSGVMMIVLIYLMAGGFQGAAAAMGGKDSVVNLCLHVIPVTFLIPGTKNLIYKKIEGNSRKKQFLQEIDISVVLDDVVIGTLNPDFINKSKSSNR